MSQDESTEILQRYREGSQDAATELFDRYVGRLTLLARSRLSPRLASRTDPDDIVLSAYRSFFIGARDGRFVLARNGDLWRLLVSITMHKLHRHVRRHVAEKRAVTAEQNWMSAAEEAFLVSRERSPEEAIAVADELESVMSSLTPCARRVLELRLQGSDLSAIADETGRCERTIRRTLRDIRTQLAQRLERDTNV